MVRRAALRTPEGAASSAAISHRASGRIAVLLSTHALEKDQRGARLQAWIAEAIALAQDGLGHVGIW